MTITRKQSDIVIYGASGYTGRLVAEHMARRYPIGSGVTWAMAGRDADKLARIRKEIGASPDIPILIADASDPLAIRTMVKSTKVVCTTVGPYQRYGTELVAACAAKGTDYVDLCGEPAWMRAMIDAYESMAKTSGARIVFSCGFDSIPFDMGVYFLQEHAGRTLGVNAHTIKSRVRTMRGGFSGGSAASFKSTVSTARKDPSLARLLRDPFALTPGFRGAEQPNSTKPLFDDVLGQWIAPFIMAPINTKNIHRSNFLMGYPYGKDFIYDEMIIIEPGEQGERTANLFTNIKHLEREDIPRPGEGPSREERESGCYEVLLIGETTHDRHIRIVVTGDRDPGYGSSSRMIAESAVYLSDGSVNAPGGIYTPAAAFGLSFIDRLRSNAGLTFEVEP
uniref:Uncharacterized conserved protein n=1 Tax=Candidatus Kentrum sp. SD TaxID=2126332 RepID=A0A451BN60_9GAMM|nr:MAG: Uncharacterized conserved protein [Candidatus Kentron sp. SD]